MKIGFDARLYQQGLGIGRYIEQLLLRFDAMDLGDDELIVFVSPHGKEHWHPTNPRIKKVLAPFTWYSLKEQYHFPRLLASHTLDTVHFPHFNVPVWYTGRFSVTIHDLILLKMPASARRAATTRMPGIYHIKYFAYQWALRHAIMKSHSIITPTRYVKEDIVTRFSVPPEKIHAIAEAAPPPSPCTTPAPDVSTPYLLYVGNTYPHKNMDLLLSLAARLKEKGSDLHIVLAGQEDYFTERLRATIHSLGLQDVIEHIGFVSEGELVSLYCNATAYLFPSFEEGFGLPGLEAMSYGVPVIASSSSCLPEVYGDGALYASPDNPAEWLEKVEMILYTNSLRNNLREKGLRHVSSFSWDACAKSTWKVIRTL